MEKNDFVVFWAVVRVGISEEADCFSFVITDHSFVSGVSVKITLTLTVD
jgi:hypothetical protein